MGKLLGIDVGTKRVGVALTDPTQCTVTPHGTFPRAQNKALHLIRELIEQQQVEQVIIGMPLSAAGEKTEQCLDVEQFGHRLSRRIDVPIVYFDESYSSMKAKELLENRTPDKDLRKKGVIDALAASIVLEEYLSSVAEKKKDL